MLRRSFVCLLTSLLVGCDTPAAALPSPSAPVSPSATAAPSASASPTHLPVPAGATGFRVADGSKAVIRVNEVIAAVQVPGEAVVTTTKMDGEFVILADGTFGAASKIRADLDALASNESLRDEWIKFNTLQTRLFRYAEFTPTRAIGLPSPLPAIGSWTAKVEGTMKIKTVEKPVTWELAIVRDATRTTAIGNITFKFADFGMEVPANRLILSVKDEVRLQIDLVAADLPRTSSAATTCPAESSQFEFWVGDWDLAVTDPLGSGKATQHVTKDGCAVAEHYSGYFRGKAAYEATSTNAWRPDLAAWQQRYVDTSGTYWYTGTFANGTMTLYASSEAGVRANTNRVLWTNISAAGFDWIWQRTRDGGTTWPEELARIRYTRRP